jgi:hypothetical protein
MFSLSWKECGAINGIATALRARATDLVIGNVPDSLTGD